MHKKVLRELVSGLILNCRVRYFHPDKGVERYFDIAEYISGSR